MAIIKCPECGHQISDKAPVCPNCGVEIAGKIIKCPFCGEVYLKDEETCPHCHKAMPNGIDDIGEREIRPLNTCIVNGANIIPNTQGRHKNDISLPEKANTIYNDKNKRHGQTKNNRTTWIVSIIVAFAVIGTCIYFYHNAKSDKERDEYEFAMNSDDPEILQAYLNNFKDAPQEHLDSITAHLQILLRRDQDWANAVACDSKSALSDYLKSHPDSPYRQEALNKLDSIDWEQCIRLNTTDAYQMYIDEHSDGAHYEEAVIALKKTKSKEVSIDEKLAISNIFHKFFVSINSRDESGLTANIGEYINFLGKQDATRSDIVLFMHKLYKDNVESMIWSIPGKYDIQKKEIGDEQYEYDTTFMAEQKVKNTDGTECINNFRITAKVDPDGNIIEMSMTRILE